MSPVNVCYELKKNVCPKKHRVQDNLDFSGISYNFPYTRIKNDDALSYFSGESTI